jgi:hypothetical protein
MPCRAVDARNSKMFEEIIFPRFRVLRMVISDGGTHFTDKGFHIYLIKHGICHMLLLHTTLRQVARQRHPISKSRILCRRQSTKWELHGKINYPMHYGLTERPIRHH